MCSVSSASLSTNYAHLRSKCYSIDYIWIHGCQDCTQKTMDGCRIRTITGKDPLYGHSLLLYLSPHIASLRGLKQLSDDLPGGMWVVSMNGLITLDGLEKVRSVGISNSGTSIYLSSNLRLKSARALQGCCARYPENRLHIKNNNKLVCVPDSWPETDGSGDTIRAGKCPTHYGDTIRDDPTHHVIAGRVRIVSHAHKAG